MSHQVDIICGSYPPMACGVADYSRQLAKALKAGGLETRIVTTVGMDSGYDPEISAKAIAMDWTPVAAKKLAEDLAQSEAPIAHIQFPTPVYHGKWGISFLPYFLRKAGKKVVLTLHEYCMAPRGGRLKQVIAGKLADAVILTNEHDSHLFSRWKDQKALSIIPIGSNISVEGTQESGDRILSEVGYDQQTPPLLFFGFVRPGKGLETLFEALALTDVTLVIVCPEVDRDYKLALDNLSDTLKISDRIFWAGYRSELEVSSLIRTSCALALPFEDGATERRGSLLAGIEHGAVVISTKGKSTPSVFVDQQNMLLSPVGDHTALAMNIKQVMEDPDKAATIRIGAAALAERFSWDSIAEAHIRIYKSLTDISVGTGV